jgi:hypothetical protein
MPRGVGGRAGAIRHEKPSFALRRAQAQSDAKPCFQISTPSHTPVMAVLRGDVLSEINFSGSSFGEEGNKNMVLDMNLTSCNTSAMPISKSSRGCPIPTERRGFLRHRCSGFSEA